MNLLYVNGDSHAAAAEALNEFAFAEDDPTHDLKPDRRPHPDNLSVSWAQLLADKLKAELWIDAESASSNTRIIRTTGKFLTSFENWVVPEQALMIIQWSTWEREEWLDDTVYYQVNSSGLDHVPDKFREDYKKFIANIDWQVVTERAHRAIWKLHKELEFKGIPHVFFNGNNHFASIRERLDWGNSYIAPYDPSQTYDQILRKNGFKTVSANSWHFGKEAHCFWAGFMLAYIERNQIYPIK